MFQRLNILLLLFLFLLWGGCDNPFLIKVGKPLKLSGDRSSPDGVIKMLRAAYENRSLDLFEELLYSKEEFRFYIEQNEKIVDSLQKINPSQREKVNIQFELSEDFIADDFFYVYLTYNEEINVHKNLFKQADYILFSPFTPYNIEYFDITDTVINDTVYYDTLSAVAYTDETVITISSSKLTAVYGAKEHAFKVGKQVFFMKKDDEGLWAILYWFERRLK
jgi:hypothetical protein